MIELTLPIVSAVLGRMSGGGLFAHKLPAGWIPEVSFGLLFSLTIFVTTGNWFLSVLAFVLAWRGIEFGHDTGYHMGYRPDLTERGEDSLKPIVTWVSERLRFEIGGKAYCWVHMGIKGAFIGAATMSPWGLLTVITFPLGYEIAWRLQKAGYITHVQRGVLAELLSCGCAGVSLSLSMGV